MALPVVAGWLATMLIGITGSIIGRALVALGLTVVYYRGIDVALTWARDLVFSNLGGLPALAIQLIGVLQIGTCINIVFTFYGIRASLLGLNSEGFKRWVLK